MKNMGLGISPEQIWDLTASRTKCNITTLATEILLLQSSMSFEYVENEASGF